MSAFVAVVLVVYLVVTLCLRKRRNHGGAEPGADSHLQKGSAMLPGLLAGDDAGEQIFEANSGGAGYSVMIQGKILIGLLQVISELPSALSIVYPKAFQDIVGFMRIFLLDIFEVFGRGVAGASS